jgi:hypothetical protein
MRTRCRALVWLIASVAPLAAQQRLPFTGVVRDAAGMPIGGAQVVCCWSPDGALLARAEHHETTADAEGRFAVDLCIGRAYCVWAIGPAGSEPGRLVAAPSFVATGGRRRDLVADQRLPPVRLQVTGATPWNRYGPLALRLCVAHGAALPDIVIAGDGELVLPPLPTTRLTICLLDFRRRVLDSVSVETEALTPCVFPPPTVVRGRVEDADGRPVAGVSIVARSGYSHGHRWHFTPTYGNAGEPREVAVSDARGEAQGLVNGGHFPMLLAVTDGMCSRVACVVHGQRVEDGIYSDAGDDEPFRFCLAPSSLRRVRLTGVDDKVRVEGSMPCQLGFKLRNGGGGMSWQVPLTNAAGLWTGTALTQSAQLPSAWFTGEGTGPRPLCIAAGTVDEQLDLATVRALAVRVVTADGTPAPFAAVGVSHGLRGFPVHWTTHLVTDGDGRADLRMIPGDCELYAISDDGDGYERVHDVGATEVTLRLQPLATVRLRVVDATGVPVAGARASLRDHSSAQRGIERIVGEGLANPFAAMVSDDQGQIVARVPRAALGSCEVVATWRGKESAEVPLPAGSDEPILLELSR